LKIRRHCEFTAEISTPSVEVIPAKKAKNVNAASTLCAAEMKGIVAAVVLLALNPKPASVA
jgi:hypothetical protein